MDGWIDGNMSGSMDVCMGGWVDGGVDILVGRCMDGWKMEVTREGV